MTAAADSSKEPPTGSDASPTSAPGAEPTPTATTESNDGADATDLSTAAADQDADSAARDGSGHLPTVEDAEPGVTPDESRDGGTAVDEADGGAANTDPSAALADLEGPQGDPEERRLDQLAPVDTSTLDAVDDAIDEAKAAAAQLRRAQGEEGPGHDETPDDPNPPGA